MLPIIGRLFESRSPKVPAANPNMSYTGVSGGTTWGVVGTRKGALTLRKFSERNVWVRVAINRRKRELARAHWSIVRIDDKRAEPDEKFVKKVNELFKFVNDTGESLNSLLAKTIEDILVFDAGVIEKEKTLGGEIVALWSLSGDEFMPLVGWDGSDPKKPRYYQFRQGKLIASYLNTELVYMMANPRSCSPIGLSPVEALVATIEADLYGEHYEFQLMKETAPAGVLYLGGGIPAEKVQAFREQWESDIAGTRDVAIIGGGGYDAEGNTISTPPEFIPFGRSGRDEQRREYMKWLATKVAASFEMDMMAFNLSESVHRSIGENLQAKTDQGLLGLAGILESYLTREIIWELDPTHKHGFKFQDLVPTNAKLEADIDAIYNSIGVTFPNEIRKRLGQEPVAWGDIPFPVTSASSSDPSLPENPGAALESEQAQALAEATTPAEDDKTDKDDDDA